MADFFNSIFPHVLPKLDELWISTLQTLYMMSVSGGFAFFLGIILGVTLIVTKDDGILANRLFFSFLDRLINVFRSIPFVILLAALIPFSRFIVGTAIGTVGAIVPLIVGTVPFFSRQVESALSNVDRGLVEAAKAMGSGPLGIIFRVYLKESIPSLIRVSQITAISLIGLTAMAGAIGGGGLGDFAIRYGHQRGQTDITYVTIIVILLMVSVIQKGGNYIIKKTSH